MSSVKVNVMFSEDVTKGEEVDDEQQGPQYTALVTGTGWEVKVLELDKQRAA